VPAAFFFCFPWKQHGRRETFRKPRDDKELPHGRTLEQNHLKRMNDEEK
jgi:hypothetical protein